MESCYTTANDGLGIFTRIWRPTGEPRAAVIIVHGMSEHGARYAPLAERLTAAGYAVYAGDHRGHGRTAQEPGQLGHLDDEQGWSKVVADVGVICDRARREYPNVPLVLLGHSMGSMIARSYAVGASDRLDALVMTGTSSDPGLKRAAGQLVAKAQARLFGGRARSKLMDKLTFGSFNRSVAHPRTPSDWLTRDETIVDAYIADPLCGGIPTAGFFVDLLDGTRFANAPANLRQIRPDLPIYLASGAADPVGEAGKGVQEVANRLTAEGLADVTVRLYPEARHEIFNETNRDEVVDDLIEWLDSTLPG